MVQTGLDLSDLWPSRRSEPYLDQVIDDRVRLVSHLGARCLSQRNSANLARSKSVHRHRYKSASTSTGSASPVSSSRGGPGGPSPTACGPASHPAWPSCSRPKSPSRRTCAPPRSSDVRAEPPEEKGDVQRVSRKSGTHVGVERSPLHSRNAPPRRDPSFLGSTPISKSESVAGPDRSE